MLKAGYFRVARLWGVDLRLHWSVPVGALVFGSLRFEPVLWLGFAGVLLVHLVGHALMVKCLGFPLTGMDFTGFGGHCRFRGSADALEHALIAWGGLLAQGLLLLGTLLATALLGHAAGGAGALIEQAFVEMNLCLLVLNLLPFAPLDGARAWRLFPELRERGWTLPRLLMYPLWRWADRRRRRRTGGDAPDSSSAVARPSARRRTSSVPANDLAPNGGDEDELDEKPSAEAQRELAALLERIGDEAGRARKRRQP